MKKLPPYGRQAAIPANNATAYVFVDWFSWEHGNQITRARGMIFLPNESPSRYTWPVRGCGVIIMDYVGTPINVIAALALELKRSGAEAVHHVDFTDETIKKNVG